MKPVNVTVQCVKIFLKTTKIGYGPLIFNELYKAKNEVLRLLHFHLLIHPNGLLLPHAIHIMYFFAVNNRNGSNTE